MGHRPVVFAAVVSLLISQVALQPFPAIGSQDSETMSSLFPADDEVPEGLELVSDEALNLEDAVLLMSDPNHAETRFTDWEWRGSATRHYAAPEDASVPSQDADYLIVSIHHFGSAEAASEALDYIIEDHKEWYRIPEVSVETLGDESRALLGLVDGENDAALYVRQADKLFIIDAFSVEGDPTAVAVAVARTIIAKTGSDDPEHVAVQGADSAQATTAMPYGNPARTGEQPGPGPVAAPGILWEFPIGPFEDLGTSPAVADGKVYVGGNLNQFYAIDAESGTEVWNFALPAGARTSSPAVVDGTIYFGVSIPEVDEGRFYALDAATGQEQWQFARGMSESSPAVVDNVVFLESPSGLHALDAGTGAELWRVGVDSYDYAIRPTDIVVADGRVFTVWNVDSPNQNRPFPAADLHAHAVQTGEEIWSVAEGTWPLLVADDTLVFDSFLGIDVASLEDYQTRTLEHVSPAGVHRYEAESLAFSNGLLYIANNRKITALKDSSWDIAWDIDPIAFDDSDDTLLSGFLSVASAVVYGSTADGGVYAVDGSNGDLLWHGWFRRGSAGCDSVPAIGDGTMYIVCSDGYLYAIRDGAPRQFSMATDVEHPIEVDSRVIVVGETAQLRGAPSSAAVVLEELPPGDELFITGNSEEHDGITWWPVRTYDAGREGWVAEDAIEVAD
jgi:outer membrane protein assembly factor BamB